MKYFEARVLGYALKVAGMPGPFKPSWIIEEPTPAVKRRMTANAVRLLCTHMNVTREIALAKFNEHVGYSRTYLERVQKEHLEKMTYEEQVAAALERR